MSCSSPDGHADCFIAAAVFLGSSAEQTGSVVEQRWVEPACPLYLTNPETLWQ